MIHSRIKNAQAAVYTTSMYRPYSCLHNYLSTLCILLLISAHSVLGAESVPAAVSLAAGGLRLSLDDKGKIVELTNVAGDTNYRHP